MRHPSMFVAAMVWFWTLGTPAVRAQSADTGILGTVTDASGAVIPGSALVLVASPISAFNWVNWGNPSGTLGSADFGVISSARAARSMQLSIKYLF